MIRPLLTIQYTREMIGLIRIDIKETIHKKLLTIEESWQWGKWSAPSKRTPVGLSVPKVIPEKYLEVTL